MPDGANIVVGGSAAPAAAANSVLGNPTGAVAIASSIPHTGAARTFCALNSLGAQQSYLGIPAAVSYPITVALGGTGANTAAGARANLGAAGLADNNVYSGTNDFQAGLVSRAYSYFTAGFEVQASSNILASQFYANNVQFYFKGTDGVKNASFLMQTDNNFVFWVVNSSNVAQPIWACQANSNDPIIALHRTGIAASGLSHPGIGGGNFTALYVNNSPLRKMTLHSHVNPAGSSAAFYSLSGCTELVVCFYAMGVTGGASPIVIQLGTTAGWHGSSYQDTQTMLNNGNWPAVQSIAYGFPVGTNGGSAGGWWGVLYLQSLFEAGGQHWHATFLGTLGAYGLFTSGFVSLPGALDRVLVTPSSGSLSAGCGVSLFYR